MRFDLEHEEKFDNSLLKNIIWMCRIHFIITNYTSQKSQHLRSNEYVFIETQSIIIEEENFGVWLSHLKKKNLTQNPQLKIMVKNFSHQQPSDRAPHSN